jgi:hypothetical protein
MKEGGRGSSGIEAQDRPGREADPLDAHKSSVYRFAEDITLRTSVTIARVVRRSARDQS